MEAAALEKMLREHPDDAAAWLVYEELDEDELSPWTDAVDAVLMPGSGGRAEDDEE